MKTISTKHLSVSNLEAILHQATNYADDERQAMLEHERASQLRRSHMDKIAAILMQEVCGLRVGDLIEMQEMRRGYLNPARKIVSRLRVLSGTADLSGDGNAFLSHITFECVPKRKVEGSRRTHKAVYFYKGSHPMAYHEENGEWPWKVIEHG